MVLSVGMTICSLRLRRQRFSETLKNSRPQSDPNPWAIDVMHDNDSGQWEYNDTAIAWHNYGSRVSDFGQERCLTEMANYCTHGQVFCSDRAIGRVQTQGKCTGPPIVGASGTLQLEDWDSRQQCTCTANLLSTRAGKKLVRCTGWVFRTPSSLFQHRRCEIDPHYFPRRTGHHRGKERIDSGSAADVEHGIAFIDGSQGKRIANTAI